jgi:hypothetical protein
VAYNLLNMGSLLIHVVFTMDDGIAPNLMPYVLLP